MIDFETPFLFYREIYSDSDPEKNQFPIYIPTLGRAGIAKTVTALNSSGVDFYLVCEPHEIEEYKSHYPENQILNLGVSNPGSISFVRNFCKKHSLQLKAKYHWQIDDNISDFGILSPQFQFVSKHPGKLFSHVEKIVQQYSNVGAAGFCHQNFCRFHRHAISLNHQVFSCILVNNSNDCSWRPHCVEDTDFSLQLLSKKLCTLKFNYLIMKKAATCSTPGGNTNTEHAGDGRRRRAIGMIKLWPNLIYGITEKFGAYKPITNHVWKTFKHKPISINEAK